MANEKIIKALNEALSSELTAVIQYTWQHWTAEGLESPAIIEMFEKTSMDEMKHAEKLGERVVMLGGDPTTKVGEVKKSKGLKKLVQDALTDEEDAIKMYKKFIKLCADEGDPVSRLMLEEILTDEEEHADDWKTVLEKR